MGGGSIGLRSPVKSFEFVVREEEGGKQSRSVNLYLVGIKGRKEQEEREGQGTRRKDLRMELN